MTDAERAALQDVRGYAGAGRIRFSRHALSRMDQRGASRQDVRAALAAATDCRALHASRWRVTGVDRDNDELVAVVAIEDAVVVVTVF